MKHMVGKLVWALTAFAAIHQALVAYNPMWNIISRLGLGAMQPSIYYALGAAGALSMVMLIQHCVSGDSCSC